MVDSSRIIVQRRNTGLLPIANESGIQTKAPIPMNSVGASSSKVTSTCPFSYYKQISCYCQKLPLVEFNPRPWDLYLSCEVVCQCLKHQARSLYYRAPDT